MDEKEIRSLDDEDTAILFKQGWVLDQLIECESNRELETYEKAMDLARNCEGTVAGLRATSNGDKTFWEIWRMW